MSRRDNRIWQIGLVCKASSVVSHQTRWYSKISIPRGFSWIEKYKLIWQLNIISYFNIHENIVRYLSTFITTLYQIENFSHRLFFFHLVFYTQIFVWTNFIMLNNLMTHFLVRKSFSYKTHNESTGLYMKSKQVP